MEPLFDKLARQKTVRKVLANIRAYDKLADTWMLSIQPPWRIGLLLAAACLVLPVGFLGMETFLLVFIVLYYLGYIFLLINLCLIVCVSQNAWLKLANFGIFLLYFVPMAALFLGWESVLEYLGLVSFLFPVVMVFHFFYLTFTWQRHRPNRARNIVKFVISLSLTIVACTIIWQNVVAEYVYDCTDDNMVGFLTPGDWVHAWDGHSIVSVDHIVHGRGMSEPDTIKKGWSVTGLWFLWMSFTATSLFVSFLLARLPWTPRRLDQIACENR